MTTDAKRTAAPRDGERLKSAEGRKAEDAGDVCRCEETAKMTPRELLGLMMKDLAFWKKAKKE